MKPKLSAAAFVPWDDETPLDERAALAIRWILRREKESGRQAGLIVPRVDEYGKPIEAFKRGRPWSSIRSSRSFGNGPVLVFCTGMEGLDKATRSGGEVAYVAWGNDPWVLGWAAAVEATNLKSGQREEYPSSEVVDLLDHLDFAGNNGWYDQPGKRDARRILGQLDQHVTRDFTVGSMLARGHSVKSVTDLRALR